MQEKIAFDNVHRGGITLITSIIEDDLLTFIKKQASVKKTKYSLG